MAKDELTLGISGDVSKRGHAIALGNFDGMHLGHRAVFDAAAGYGNWLMVSFSPHPRRFFAPDAPPFKLTNERTEARLLQGFSGAGAVRIDFNANLAAMTPEEFLDALDAALAPSAIVTGEDFRFGKDRAGDVETLANWVKAHGRNFTATRMKEGAGGAISSSKIREALKAGDTRLAAKLLGRNHIVNGHVIKGEQRGRELGFPTANLAPKNVLLPRFGIYSSWLEIHDGPHSGRYMAASSIGVRPSFGTNEPNFESHILDFDGDIYGCEISVELVEFIRPELKFEDIDALIARMNEDVEIIRHQLDTGPSEQE